MFSLNEDKKKTPTPADGAVMDNAQQRPEADVATPSNSDPSYSNKLSTWLQHYDPEQTNQPLVTEPQTPAEQVGMSANKNFQRTASPNNDETPENSVWQPGTDTYDWMKAVYGDPEEDAARERRNRTILGITAVGDALRHFGNIYHTTKGAPAQTLTNATKEESDRQIKDTMLLQQQRQKANEMLLKHQKMEADRLYRQQEAQRKNYELALKEENLRQQAAYRQKQSEMTDARIKNLSDRLAFDVEKQKHKVDYDNQVLGLRKATEQRMRWYQGEMVKLKRQSNAIAAQRAANAIKKGNGLLSQGKGDSIYYAAGSVWGVPKAVKNKSNAKMIYDMLPKKVKLKNPANTEEDMISAVIANLGEPGIGEALSKLGVYNLGGLDVEDLVKNGSDTLKGAFMDAFGLDDDLDSDELDTIQDDYLDTEFE